MYANILFIYHCEDIVKTRSARLFSSYISNVIFYNFYWPGNQMVTDVPRQMSLYRFLGFTLLSYYYKKKLFAHIDTRSIEQLKHIY